MNERGLDKAESERRMVLPPPTPQRAGTDRIIDLHPQRAGRGGHQRPLRACSQVLYV